MPARDERDPYVVLEVASDASPEVIEAAFRRAAFRWHPDRNADDPETAHRRFVEIGEAYAVLSDRKSRARHDASRERAPGRKGSRRRPETAAGFARAAQDAEDAATRRQTSRSRSTEQQIDQLTLQLARARGLGSARWSLHLSTAAVLMVSAAAWLFIAADPQRLWFRFAWVPAVVAVWWVRAIRGAFEARRTLAQCRLLAERMVRTRG